MRNRTVRWLLTASALVFTGCLSWILTHPTPDPPPAEPVPALAVAIADDPDPYADGIRFCGRTETLTDFFSVRPWPVRRITWTIDRASWSSAGIDPAIAQDAFRQAWQSWADHLDIEPVYVDTAAAALVRSKAERIDGAGKILAQSELADGTLTPRHQVYDSAESWAVSAQPVRQIDLTRVAAHEIGHVLGLVHDSENSGALMAPAYSKAIRFPGKRDIDRALQLGYKPKPANPSINPAPSIQLNVSVSAEAIAEGLRRVGYTVERPKP